MFLKNLLTLLPFLATAIHAVDEEKYNLEATVKIQHQDQTGETLCLTATGNEFGQIGAFSEIKGKNCYEDSDQQVKFQVWDSYTYFEGGASVYSLKNDDQTIFCLSRGDESGDNGHQLSLVECDPRQSVPYPADRHWSFEGNTTHIHIDTVTDPGGNHSPTVTKCLDVKDGLIVKNGDSSEATLQLWECYDDNPNQTWNIEKTS